MAELRAGIVRALSAVMARPVVMAAAAEAAAPTRRVPARSMVAQRILADHAGVVTAIRPNIAIFASGLLLPQQSMPRDQVTVPISPVPEPTDTVLFEDPSDPARKLYLPRYRVIEQDGQWLVRIRQSGDEWALVIQLATFPAPEVAALGGSPEELPHEKAMILRYRLAVADGGAGIQHDENLTLAPNAEGVLEATLLMPGLLKRDEVTRALTLLDRGTQLIVRRSAEVAVPVPSADAGEPDAPVAGSTRFIGSAVAMRARFADVSVRDHRRREHVRDHRAPFADISVGQPLPTTTQPPEPAPTRPPAGPQYQQSVRYFEDVADPETFNFPMDTHPYIYEGIPEISTQSKPLRPVIAPFEGRNHVYYHDPLEPRVFFFLPDSFKIPRKPKEPHGPVIRAVFQTGDLDEVTVQLEFLAVPHVDGERLRQAAGALLLEVPEDLRSQGIVFEPLEVPDEQLEFSLTVPRAEGSAETPPVQPSPPIDLKTGIAEILTFSLAQFQAVFDAMLGASSVLFQGRVQVTLGSQVITVPFTSRLDDLEGDLFEQAEAPAEGGRLQVTIANVIESPVRVSSLAGWIVTDGGSVAATAAEFSEQVPIELPPGKSLSFVLTPQEALPPDGSPHAMLDLAGVEVLPDKEAIWDTIIEGSTLPEHFRKIRVNAKWIFQAQEGATDPILGLVVQFERGNTVELDADTREVEGLLHAPISDLILRREIEGPYRYRLNVIRRSGQTSDPDWRTEPTGAEILVPDVR